VSRAFFWLLLATAATAALFLAFPAIDLVVGSLIREPGGRFPLEEVSWALTINRGVPWLLAGLAAALLLLGVAAQLGRPVAGIGLRKIAYVVAVFLIGPGLLVNAAFKDHLGRARPRDIPAGQESVLFTPPFVPSQACARNCSFPAGDASAGFAFLALAFVLPRDRRRAATGAAIALGSALGALRLLQGAHFFSDVIFAGLLMGLVAVGLHLLTIRPARRPRPDGGTRAPPAR